MQTKKVPVREAIYNKFYQAKYGVTEMETNRIEFNGSFRFDSSIGSHS